MLKPGFQRGVQLFNAARFFEAHEALEDAWREVPRQSPQRRHLQGMVQLAVAFHHQSTGNQIGACSVLKRALRNLDDAGASFPDLDLWKLRLNLQEWLRVLESADGGLEDRGSKGHAAPPLPKILPKIVRRAPPS